MNTLAEELLQDPPAFALQMSCGLLEPKKPDFKSSKSLGIECTVPSLVSVIAATGDTIGKLDTYSKEKRQENNTEVNDCMRNSPIKNRFRQNVQVVIVRIRR